MGINKTKANTKLRSQKVPSPYGSKRSPEQLKELDEISFDDRKGSRSKAVKSSITKTPTKGRSSTRIVIDEANDVWSPTTYAAFKLLVSARFAAALWTTISDCDETYNYWEPTHFLLYGKGFQTWEYSPEYALRSYTYLLVHALPAKIYDYFFKPNPLLVFFLIRCFLAFISASTEVFLYRAIRKYFGGNISRIALVTSLFAPGMFVSTSAFLPSSFSSYMTALAVGAWLEELYELSIFTVAVSALLSWPFAALTGILIAVDIVILQRKVTLFATWSVLSLVVILFPLIYIDSSHYGKWVIAPWNIVKYNILSSKGPDLYGTEPWSYYAVNGLLNFNLLFAITLISPFLVILTWKHAAGLKEKFMVIGTTLIWIGVFIAQPHKEERFLFPIFPLIPICGAIGIDSVQQILLRRFIFLVNASQNWSKRFTKWLLARDIHAWLNGLGLLLIITTNFISCSRIVALHYGYRAPFDVFFNLQRDGTLHKFEAEAGDKGLTLCYGKEWYRFPSSFFLPSTKWNPRFIQSDFKGQLPNLYPAFDPEGTMRLAQQMNDRNAEEPSRYVPLTECDFLVDLIDESRTSLNEPNYAASTEEWDVISEQEFINSSKSHPFFRAFYIPFISQQYTEYNRYVFLQRRRKQIPNMKPQIRKKVSSSGKTGKEFSDDLDDSL